MPQPPREGSAAPMARLDELSAPSDLIDSMIYWRRGSYSKAGGRRGDVAFQSVFQLPQVQPGKVRGQAESLLQAAHVLSCGLC